jgi:hypothetical protein
MSATTTGTNAEAAVPVQEAVMGQPFPAQHPAVVLRSHFRLVRALLAIAMAAVLALSVAVVILATDEDELAGSAPAAAGKAASLPNPGVRYDGGPEEGTRAIIPVPQAPDARYDGGPDEGTRALPSVTPAPVPERTTDGSSEQPSPRPVEIPRSPGGLR